MNTALRAAALVTVAASAAPFAILTLPGCAEHATPTLTPAQKKKAAAAIVTEAKPAVSVGAVIEDQVRLIGYDIDKTTVAPGQSFTVTYYLEALAQPMGDNSIFVHLPGQEERPQGLDEPRSPSRRGPPAACASWRRARSSRTCSASPCPPTSRAGEAKLYWGLWRGEYRLKIKNPEAVRPTTTRAGSSWPPIHVKGATGRRCRRPRRCGLADDALVTVDGKLDEAVLDDGRPGPRSSPRPNGTGCRPRPTRKAAFLWTPTTLYVGVRADRHRRLDATSPSATATRGNRRSSSFSSTPTATRRTTWNCRSPRRTSCSTLASKRHRSDLAKARAWNMAGLRTGGRGRRHAQQPRRRGQGLHARDGASRSPKCPAHRTRPAAAGDVWRVNLFRWDFPKGGRQQPSAFSPPIVPDFHALDRFGRLAFVDPAAPQPVSAPPSAARTAAQSAPAPASGAAVSAPATVARRIATKRLHRGKGEANLTPPHLRLPSTTTGLFTEESSPMAGSDKRKQSLYFPEDMLKEIQAEATRQDRSLSWIVQKAWKIARKEISKYPSINDAGDDFVEDDDDDDEPLRRFVPRSRVSAGPPPRGTAHALVRRRRRPGTLLEEELAARVGRRPRRRGIGVLAAEVLRERLRRDRCRSSTPTRSGVVERARRREDEPLAVLRQVEDGQLVVRTSRWPARFFEHAHDGVAGSRLLSTRRMS
jgi:uncharacterized small protein (TIGR04563 family)